MVDKIKDYIQYKKNKKTAKRELARAASVILPTVREFSESKSDLFQFVKQLANESKQMRGEELFSLIIREVADKLSTNENRLMEIFQYIVNLSPDEIKKILVHSISETIKKDE